MSPSAPLLAARGGVLGHGHGAEHRDGAVRILDDALLPLARRAKSADDTLLTGTRSVPAWMPGAAIPGRVTVTIPAATPPNSYFLLACADDQNAVVEKNEDNNCIATARRSVTVARPDLVETAATTNPPAPVRAPGTTFSVTDTVRNLGPVPSGASTTRYYLSLDGVKSAGDTLLTGSRGVPGLAAGASQSGTVTVTIPAATPLNTYFLLACADDLNAVAESNEANNCIASATATVTVTRPDLVENTVSAPPATKARGTSFPVTDAVQNVGAVASGGLGDALLPLARCGEECRRRAPDREPDGPRSGGRGQPFRDGHGDHPRGHAAQYLLRARLCRCPEHGGGDRRDQQLQGLQHHGDGNSPLIGRVASALFPVVRGRGPRPLPSAPSTPRQRPP